MREYVVDGLPTDKEQFSAFLKRNIANGDTVSVDPERAEGIPWLVDPGTVGAPPSPPAVESFDGLLSNAAATAVDDHELTPTGALELGTMGLIELGISKRSAKAIVKAAEGNE